MMDDEKVTETNGCILGEFVFVVWATPVVSVGELLKNKLLRIKEIYSHKE